jgi:hypothetical protein
MIGYCVKCKNKKSIKDPKISLTAKGGYIAKGFCEQCGTVVCKMMSEADAKKAVEDEEAVKDF